MHLHTSTAIATIFAAQAIALEISSPGILGGNVVKVPVQVPVNVCGNTIGMLGLLNPAFGNTCPNNKVRRANTSLLKLISYNAVKDVHTLDAEEGVRFSICGREFRPGKVEHTEESKCDVGDQRPTLFAFPVKCCLAKT